VVVTKGWRRGGRKWFIRLDRNRVAVLVNYVHLIDHGWPYQNPPFHPLPSGLKTRCFTPRKLQSDAVLESIDCGESRSRTTNVTPRCKSQLIPVRAPSEPVPPCELFTTSFILSAPRRKQ
jgi:hypothetical protein